MITLTETQIINDATIRFGWLIEENAPITLAQFNNIILKRTQGKISYSVLAKQYRDHNNNVVDVLITRKRSTYTLQFNTYAD